MCLQAYHSLRRTNCENIFRGSGAIVLLPNSTALVGSIVANQGSSPRLRSNASVAFSINKSASGFVASSSSAHAD